MHLIYTTHTSVAFLLIPRKLLLNKYELLPTQACEQIGKRQINADKVTIKEQDSTRSSNHR